MSLRKFKKIVTMVFRLVLEIKVQSNYYYFMQKDCVNLRSITQHNEACITEIIVVHYQQAT